jgi:hypothetical protein
MIPSAPLDILPNPSLITEPAKKSDMICISSRGIGGEDDFSAHVLKEARLAAEKGGGIRSIKSICSENIDF